MHLAVIRYLNTVHSKYTPEHYSKWIVRILISIKGHHTTEFHNSDALGYAQERRPWVCSRHLGISVPKEEYRAELT